MFSILNAAPKHCQRDNFLISDLYKVTECNFQTKLLSEKVSIDKKLKKNIIVNSLDPILCFPSFLKCMSLCIKI